MKSVLTYLKSLFTHKDVFLNIFMCIVWGNMLLGYTRGIINHLPLLYQYTDQVIIAIVVIPLFLSIPLLINKFTLFDYTFFCISYSHLRNKLCNSSRKYRVFK